MTLPRTHHNIGGELRFTPAAVDRCLRENGCADFEGAAQSVQLVGLVIAELRLLSLSRPLTIHAYDDAQQERRQCILGDSLWVNMSIDGLKTLKVPGGRGKDGSIQIKLSSDLAWHPVKALVVR